VIKYEESKVKCTSCTFPNFVIDTDSRCKERCSLGSEPVKEGTSVVCRPVSCSDLCKKCRDSVFCEECWDTTGKEKKSATGVLKTAEGRCMPCVPQNGLRTVLNSSGVPNACEEICGDEMLYQTTWAEQLKIKTDFPEKILTSMELRSKHFCDDANVAPGDGCSAACEIEEGFVCRQTVLPDNRQRSYCLKKVDIKIQEKKNSVELLTYTIEFDKETNISQFVLNALY